VLRFSGRDISPQFWLAPEMQCSGEVPIYYLFKNQKYKNSNLIIHIILCYIGALLFIVIRQNPEKSKSRNRPTTDTNPRVFDENPNKK
jgi:hypothetical protein